MNIHKIICFLLFFLFSGSFSFARSPLQSTFGGYSTKAVENRVKSFKDDIKIFLKKVLGLKDLAESYPDTDKYSDEKFIKFLIENEKKTKGIRSFREEVIRYANMFKDAEKKKVMSLVVIKTHEKELRDLMNQMSHFYEGWRNNNKS